MAKRQFTDEERLRLNRWPVERSKAPGTAERRAELLVWFARRGHSKSTVYRELAEKRKRDATPPPPAERQAPLPLTEARMDLLDKRMDLLDAKIMELASATGALRRAQANIQTVQDRIIMRLDGAEPSEEPAPAPNPEPPDPMAELRTLLNGGPPNG